MEAGAIGAARQLFLDEANVYGCAETVFKVLNDVFGLPDTTDAAPAMALNGGIAYSGGPCGAISGAAMAVGLLAGRRIDDRSRAKRVARLITMRLMDEFQETYGASDCRDLIGVDFRAEDGHRAFIESGIWRDRCMSQIEFAIRRLAPLADERDWERTLLDLGEPER